MTALDLYKYINDNNIEWHYQDNDGTEDVMIFPYSFQIGDFAKLLCQSSFDDGGIALVLLVCTQSVAEGNKLI